MIPSQSTKVTYRGDGITTVFPFNFHYISGSDVKVAIYEIATDISTPLDRDYYVDTIGNTVTYPGYPPGQTINPEEQPPVLTSDYKLVIYRETPITQEVDLGDKYPLSTLEQMDDKAILIAQELAEVLERCVKLDVTSDITSQQLLERIFEQSRAAVSAAAEAVAAAANALNYKNAAAASASNAETAANNVSGLVIGEHNHDDRYYTESEVDSLLSTHNHDGRYYTESEIDTKLNGKANSNHSHSQYLTSHQDISGKANLASPSFTGTVTAPTLTVTTALNIPGGSIWIS